MPLHVVVVVVLTLGTSVHGLQPPQQPECRDAKDCRQQALEAAAREEYERFHDLAWRALQKARQNDPESMTLVARAQSLSGRPHDALVMLRRLAAMNVATDAATSDDFRRVRALPSWPELEAQLAGVAASDAPKPKRTERAASSKTAPAAAGGKTDPEPARSDVREARAEPIVGEPAEAIRFTTTPFVPAGLAYDSVSNRFIVGYRESRKLAVVGERSQNVSNLASADTAGFGDITGLAIDPREGDLWVISTADQRAMLHKLQLISGRLLFAVEAEAGTPARFSDVGVTPTSTVVVLDDAGRTLFSVPRGAKELRVAAKLELEDPVSVAAPSDSVAYVAHRGGLARVDLASGGIRPVSVPKGQDLTALEWIRPHETGLVGIQRTATGLFRLVRMRLDAAGTRVTNVALLDREVPMAAPASAVVSGDVLYYLSANSAADAVSPEQIIKRVKLR